MAIFNTQIKGGGSAPAVINSLNVTPSTSAQTITATGGVDGYSPVNVSAVTSSIDANIVAGNIKNGVSILGVTGNYSGTTPSGTLNITTNGVYDVTNYASADVSVSGTGPTYYIEKSKDANNKLVKGTSFINLTGATDIGEYALAYAYFHNGTIPSSISMSSLTAISGNYACANMFNSVNIIFTVDLSNVVSITGQAACSNMFQDSAVTSIDLSSLTTINGTSCLYYFCYNAQHLTSIDLSSLTTISGTSSCQSMLQRCTNLTILNLPALTTITSSNWYMCHTCTSLTTVNMPLLSNISASNVFRQAFQDCSSLTTLSFPSLTSNSFGAYTDQFQYMLSGCSGVTVHFPSNLQSVIGSWSDVIAGFGGTNTTVLFDLPATE